MPKDYLGEKMVSRPNDYTLQTGRMQPLVKKTNPYQNLCSNLKVLKSNDFNNSSLLVLS